MSNAKMQKVKRGHVRSHNPLLQFWDPLKIPKVGHVAPYRHPSTNEKCKIRSKVVTWGSRDAILEFCDPPNISGMNKARDFKFAHISMTVSTNEKNAKLGQKVSCGGHVTQFGTEMDGNEKMQNWVKRGHVGVT